MSRFYSTRACSIQAKWYNRTTSFITATQTTLRITYLSPSDSRAIKTKTQVRNLAVLIDSGLSFCSHSKAITKSAFYHLKKFYLVYNHSIILGQNTYLISLKNINLVGLRLATVLYTGRTNFLIISNEKLLLHFRIKFYSIVF